MKTRPILFNGAMVRALLDGSKTQTRREVKLPPAPMTLGTWEPTTVGGNGTVDKHGVPAPEMPAIWHTRTGAALTCPHGQPGDQLWVRETWRTDATLNGDAPSTFSHWPVKYEADGAVLDHLSLYGKTDGKTRTSIHMPRWASRILLEIVSVRVERLQDISEADAKAEGAKFHQAANYLSHSGWWHDGEHVHPTATLSYRELWESINGAGSWDANPFVWVIEFKRVTL